VNAKAVPQRPPAWEERWASRVFRAFSPRLPRVAQPDPPARLAPWQAVSVPRLEGDGVLTGTWYEAPGAARGAVLLLHPWVKWGKSFFHRQGRIEALRGAGYHALTLDLAGFGDSTPPVGFYDRDVAAGLAFLRRQAGSLPLHVWGVSSGGFWAHLALSRTGGAAGAFFEDVSPHLIEWSWRVVPRRRPGYLFVRCCFPRSYRFLDLRRQAAAMRLAAAAYVSGTRDLGVLPSETRQLAYLARGQHLVVEGAGHLGVIQGAADKVVALALGTFLRAEGHLRCRQPRQPGQLRARTAPAVSPLGAGRTRARPRPDSSQILNSSPFRAGLSGKE
jgi:Alpha/beta hydrolase family